ncbi:MAG: type IV secretory system conjugative DNA transfer family protein, partial [Anaerolineales bacterium]|nr:type IV secretory system conjugative DNA transfer family protein [Anaerolineales bacterium]
MTDDTFYLGRLFDAKTAKATNTPVEYNPADLTTHAVVTGMTGSGKTGLCVALLEEAALHGVPAIIIDPKGDLTNLLLHFPDLLPQDFQPWIDPDIE